MSVKNVLKNFNLFVDGKGFAGQIEEYVPPVLTLQTEDFRPGGLDSSVPITMGLEKLETSFSLVSYDDDVLTLWGIERGQNIPFVARGAIQSNDGTVKAVIHTMRGQIKQLDRGTWKAGQIAPIKVAMDLNYYKEEFDGKIIHEIDIENMVRTINGLDALSEIRGALGI
ncbi:MAG: phage major tail tube protein [Desulfobacteraceae bacterium]|nr:phage major tail tube protein [Desulfobacteraceae bacterium]